MARAVQIKAKAALGEDGEKIGELLNCMIGVSDADPIIVRPKYIIVRTNICTLSSTLNLLTANTMESLAEQQKQALNDIGVYTKNLMEATKVDVMDEEKIPYERAEINKIYRELKENEYVRTLTVLKGSINEYKGMIERDKITIDTCSWVNKVPGPDYCPFSKFSSLDLKAVISSDSIPDMMKIYIFKIFYKCCDLINKIVSDILSPDVDKIEFGHTIRNSILALRKQIPRCDKAFNEISKSVELFNDKFDNYYMEFVQSQSPTSIIHSYLIDVAAKNKTDLKITHQMQKIIRYFQKQQRNVNLPPNAKIAMDKLSSSFETLKAKRKQEKQNKNNKSAVEDDPVANPA